MTLGAETFDRKRRGESWRRKAEQRDKVEREKEGKATMMYNWNKLVLLASS